ERAGGACRGREARPPQARRDREVERRIGRGRIDGGHDRSLVDGPAREHARPDRGPIGRRSIRVVGTSPPPMRGGRLDRLAAGQAGGATLFARSLTWVTSI